MGLVATEPLGTAEVQVFAVCSFVRNSCSPLLDLGEDWEERLVDLLTVVRAHSLMLLHR